MAADEVTPTSSETQSSSVASPDVVESTVPVEPIATVAAEAEAGEAEGAIETAESEVLTALEATITRLSSEGDTLRQQLEEQSLQFQRLAADFDNFRKRTQREKDELSEQVKCLTITELLPVVDNFERARAHISPQTEAEEKIHRSYQGVYKQLVEGLKRIGVSAMRPEGQLFDPNLHEAVMREASDDYPEGTVLEQLVRGYVLGERVLRHAMVKVSIPGEPAPESTITDSGSTAE